jgi:hypothetical protein
MSLRWTQTYTLTIRVVSGCQLLVLASLGERQFKMLSGSSTVRDRCLGSSEHGADSVFEADVKEHPF